LSVHRRVVGNHARAFATTGKASRAARPAGFPVLQFGASNSGVNVSPTVKVSRFYANSSGNRPDSRGASSTVFEAAVDRK
jgi:hypothetical protein